MLVCIYLNMKFIYGAKRVHRGVPSRKRAGLFLSPLALSSYDLTECSDLESAWLSGDPVPPSGLWSSPPPCLESDHQEDKAGTGLICHLHWQNGHTHTHSCFTSLSQIRSSQCSQVCMSIVTDAEETALRLVHLPSMSLSCL